MASPLYFGSSMVISSQIEESSAKYSLIVIRLVEGSKPFFEGSIYETSPLKYTFFQGILMLEMPS